MHENYRQINELLMCIGRRRQQIGEAAMETFEILPSQHFLLVCLRRMGRCVSQSRLAEMMQVSPASVARTLKALDRDGYIRRSDGADGRCNEIIITARGEAVLECSCRLFGELDERSFAGFDENELSLFENMLSRMLENLNQIRNEKEMKE